MSAEGRHTTRSLMSILHKISSVLLAAVVHVRLTFALTETRGVDRLGDGQRSHQRGIVHRRWKLLWHILMHRCGLRRRCLPGSDFVPQGSRKTEQETIVAPTLFPVIWPPRPRKEGIDPERNFIWHTILPGNRSKSLHCSFVLRRERYVTLWCPGSIPSSLKH